MLNKGHIYALLGRERKAKHAAYLPVTNDYFHIVQNDGGSIPAPLDRVDYFYLNLPSADDVIFAWLGRAGSKHTGGFFSKIYNLFWNWIYGAESIINGEFDTNVNGWTTVRAALSWESDGYCRMTQNNGSTTTMALRQDGILTASKRYNIRLKAKSDLVIGSLNLIASDFTDRVNVLQPNLTPDWQDFEFLGTSVNTYFRFFSGQVDDGDIIDIDSISCMEVIPTTTYGTPPNDAIQETPALQPLYNDSFDSLEFTADEGRFMQHPNIVFPNGQAWSITTNMHLTGNTNPNSYAGTIEDTNNFLEIAVTDLLRFSNAAGTLYVFNLVDLSGHIGKTVQLTVVADGLGGLELYVNGVSGQKLTAVVTSFTLNSIGRATPTLAFGHIGLINAHLIRSVAMTPTEVLDEFNEFSAPFPPG